MLARTIVVSVALSVVMAVAVTQAQEAPRFHKGDRTLTLGGSGGSDKNFDVSYISVHAGTAWFLSDNVSVGVRQELSFVDLYGSDEWSGSTRLGMDYVMNLSNISPYVGASIGYVYGDRINNQFIAGPDLGVMIFVNDTTFISLAVEYQILFEGADDTSVAYDDGRFVYIMGLGVKW